MKKLKTILFAICIFSFFTSTAQNKMVQELHQNWKFRQARLNNWYPAKVPGTVHTDLMSNKIIEDPYYRLNERGVQWVDKEDWIYETTFAVSKEVFAKNNIRLLFKGLDTYADIYLNDQKLLSADNMFREWTIDIKDNIRQDSNVLKIYFHSPIKMDMPKFDSLPFFYHASNDQSENGGVFNKKVSIFARKAGYHYGWDWGPRIVTSGIWRDVFLEGWNDVRIENIFYDQQNVTAKSATINTIVEVYADRNLADAIIEVKDDNTGSVFASKKIQLQKGFNKIAVPFVMKNPKLWWSLGLGEAHLYNFKTSIIVDNAVAETQNDRIGIRSVKVINKPDDYGKSFYIELNGRPVFAKGANYIPNDMFIPRVSNEKYETVVLDAVKANMNMLRIWGGGIYENEIFYNLCDKYGIMVWQDFMYACSMYPAEGAMLENMRQEAIQNVRRLRNHPSIALWCGNNENQDAWLTWGWKRDIENINPKYADLIWNQYVEQFHKMLPSVVKEHHPGMYYTPTSPFAELGKPSNDSVGDMHYWRVWHGKEPIEQYNIQRSRFFSEYGFQSFPEFESVKLYAPESRDWNIYSEVMMSHQRGGAHANGLIESYLLSEYKKPKNFEMFLYMNQVLQGDAIKTAMEAHRRDMPYCMGTLYWQHNDVWPVASWSARDYYGRWKAQQYFAREAYKDILVSPIQKDGKLHVYVVSDRTKDADGVLDVNILTLNGEALHKYSKNVKVNANASNDLYVADINQILKSNAAGDVVVHATFTEKGKASYKNNYFLTKQKDINYPVVNITKTVTPKQGGYEVKLKSDKYARAVFMSLKGIENFFENNYFDILPGETVTVKVNTNISLSDFNDQLKIVSLIDGF